LIRGLVAIGLGIAAITWPSITLWALVVMFGAFAIMDGVTGILLGLRGEPDGTVWWTMILLGVLAIGAGVTAFAWPALTALILVTIIAVWSIIRGVLEIAAAISLRKEIDDEWILVLSGLLSLGFGVLLWMAPGEGALALVLLIGAYMIAVGIMAVALSLRLRKLHYKSAAA
jgi:uncharacterized membrane protein HdeD (DUF308 family)